MSEPLHNSRHDDPSGPAAGVRTARAQFEAARRRKQELIATGRLTAAPRETYSPLSGKTLAGFTLIREIHRGGQGVVYQALQQSTNRNVAIKVLLDGAHASPSARHRFDREIELVAGLRHPNVISVFHSDQTADGLRYCVMDYVRGRPLTTHVRETGLTLHDTLRLFARVCDAVNHAHQKGVIHRDLKPSNILVDDNGDPKILDFGLAKIVGGQPETLVSVTGQFVGTLPYMSPEQTRGNPDEVDTRTDVYALGVLLYEVLTGRYPYPVIGHVTDVLRHIAETDPTPPSRHGWQGLDADDSAGSSLRTWWPGSSIRRQSGGIDDDIQTIVLKALAKNRERRYQSAGELSRDIGHYLAGEPIESKRDSFAYVLGKQLRRQRAAVAVGMAFLLLIVAGLATSLTFAFKAKHALLEKESQQERAESFGDFLKEVLTLADPTKAKGEKLTMREALDRAAKRIDDGALREQPLVEADVRFTIGSTYWALSLWREAEAQFRAADVIQSRELGDEHTDTLRTRFNLARAKIRTDLTGAAKLAQATLETQQRVLGPDHLDTLRSRVLTGVAHGWAGRFAESESLLRSAIEGRRRTVGQDHVDTAYFLNRMGEMYTTFSYPEKAEPLHREALRIHSQALGDEHPDTITSQHDLAQSLYNQFRPEEAEVIYRKTLETSSRILGPENPGTLAFQLDLAAALSRQGRHAEAEPIYRETLAAQRRTLGLPDFDTLTTQRLMAGALAQQRKYPEAEALLREALDVAREKFGPEDGGTTISLMCTLASVLADQEKDVEAEQIARQVLEFQDRQRPRPWPGEVQQSSLALIRVLRRRGAFDEAQRIERQLNELWLKAASAPDATTYTLYMAAWRLLKPFDESLRDSTEALKLAQRINEGAGQKYPRHLRTLALAYLQTGDVVRATKTWKQAVAVSPDDETRATTLNVAASELLEVTPEALCDPHQALEFARQANELTDHKNANYLDTLALAYFRTGDAPKAIEFQVQALKFLPKDSLQRPDFEAQLAEFKLVKENPGNDD